MEYVNINVNGDVLTGVTPYTAEQIREYNEKGYWLNETYEDVLMKVVQKQPNKLFVVDQFARLTYGQFKEKVNRCAAFYKKIGIKKYDRIIVQLPNRHEFLIVLFALKKIGAIPVLAVPRQDTFEINQIIDLIGAIGWITSDRDGTHDLLPRISEVRSKNKQLSFVLMIGEQDRFPQGTHDVMAALEEVTDQEVATVKHEKPDPNDVALIILTGGTTGVPKAVPRTHNSILANIRYISHMHTDHDVSLLTTPVGHGMAHQGAIGCTLMKGGTLVICNSPRPEDILKAVHHEKVTRLTLVPTQLIGILEHPHLDQFDLSSLKYVRAGGASLHFDIFIKATEFFHSFGCTVGGSAYGSSEGPSAHHLTTPTGELVKSIGKPVVDGDHWIALGENEEVLQPNEIGELAVKGPGVFTGYYNSEKENEKVFTKAGYYKTGDVGKIDENGFIFITGRQKDIIQRGAEGIIPSEMEDLIAQHSAVDQVAVVAMPDPYMGERACAYVILHKQEKVNDIKLKDITDFLKEKGAGVLLWPERLEIIDEFPLTNVGKLDKKALRKNIHQKLIQEGVLEKD
ncbi:acyl--CoA ligase [Niallia endozanthoxylica]|uniref:Acyl--CoA ligase n=1 Tax=Niallia endozanthoxylica TaxID=2036016 RepID=A0A5J5HVZ7_9BACI|nr:acyl--CoA ligase [Niallia endozanthoxylica]